jgi:hypothetical protein
MRSFLAALVLIAVFGFGGWLFGPPLWQDFQLKDAKLVPAAGAEITEAKCRSKLFVVTWCEIDYKSGGRKGSFKYLLFGSMDGERVALRQAGGVMTTTIGMSYLTNRLITFAVLVLIGLFLVGAGIRGMVAKA